MIKPSSVSLCSEQFSGPAGQTCLFCGGVPATEHADVAVAVRGDEGPTQESYPRRALQRLVVVDRGRFRGALEGHYGGLLQG